MSAFKAVARLLICASLGYARAAGADVVTDWNIIAMPLINVGHAGPGGLTDLAAVHAAIHDAVQAYEKRFRPYAKSIEGASGSPVAAVATAARDVLVGRLPMAQAMAADAAYLLYMEQKGLELTDPGVAVGNVAAVAVLGLRGNDGSFPTPGTFPAFNGGTDPGQWRPTPPGYASMNFPWLGGVLPYTIDNLSHFAADPPPPLDSLEYAEAYNEVKTLGALSSPRTDRQNHLVRFYNENFAAQWNGVMRLLADRHLITIGDTARLMALANMAAADAAICAWDAKKFFNFWRPLTAIREGANDGNDLTIGDSTWTPRITTPPYPDYTSGANNLTGAYARMLALFFATDHVSFEISSQSTALLPDDARTITYDRFSDVAKDVVDVRVWQGIHFRFADTEARSQARRIANHAFKNFLQPLRR